MTTQHNVLITAAGGNIGSELVPLLLAANHRLVLPTTDADRLRAKLPPQASTSSVTIEEGSLQDPTWLESIISKNAVDVVFLCLTGADELLTTLNFFDSMRRAGSVKHLVYLSACGDYTSPEGIKALMRICSAEHVLVKSIIEQKILYAEFPWTTTRIGPTLFMGNDLRSKPSMMEGGLFDEPLGEKGVSRVATSDIALAVRNIVADPGKFDGKKIVVGSRRKFTGSEVADLWSDVLGRKVVIHDNDEASLDKFERHFHHKTGRSAAWARDLRLMYSAIGNRAFGPTDEEYEELVELLGKKPEDYPAWVKQMGESWTAE